MRRLNIILAGLLASCQHAAGDHLFEGVLILGGLACVGGCCSRRTPLRLLLASGSMGNEKPIAQKTAKDHKEFRDKPCADPVWNPATSSSITFAGVAMGYNSSR